MSYSSGGRSHGMAIYSNDIKLFTRQIYRVISAYS